MEVNIGDEFELGIFRPTVVWRLEVGLRKFYWSLWTLEIWNSNSLHKYIVHSSLPPPLFQLLMTEELTVLKIYFVRLLLIITYYRRVIGDSIPGRDKPSALKQVDTSSLPNARQQVWVSRVLGSDYYQGVARVTVGVAL